MKYRESKERPDLQCLPVEPRATLPLMRVHRGKADRLSTFLTPEDDDQKAQTEGQFLLRRRKPSSSNQSGTRVGNQSP